ncbi:hypothetical protein CRENBAI_024025 [Crenichthys baileyi]|uniref:Uncharacterized protein n=1 Tax=Crenichthys baileyi TaxID=28760 RepID=A0AAV9RF78_9TELE
MPSSARCSEATPKELEERLRCFARQIKSFRRTSLMYSSPELMARIRQMERDYETAVRQFYCRPPLPHQDSRELLLQSSPRRDSGELLLQSSPRRDSGELLLQSSPRRDSRELLLQSSPRRDSRELLLQSSPRRDSRELLLQSSPRQDSRELLWSFRRAPRAGCLHFQPDLKSASTSSTRHRGRRKRDASAHVTEGLCDASAPAHVTEGPADASAPSLQGYSGKLVLVLASEPCDEGFEEEEPPDPVFEGFKGHFGHCLTHPVIYASLCTSTEEVETVVDSNTRPVDEVDGFQQLTTSTSTTGTG